MASLAKETVAAMTLWNSEMAGGLHDSKRSARQATSQSVAFHKAQELDGAGISSVRVQSSAPLSWA